jgi:hypothetical protein
VKTEPLQILPARWDWPSVIGNFILNFGSLDYFVFVFLKDHLPATEFDKVREWHLKDRLARIAQYLEKENYPAEERENFSSIVLRLEPLRELRNQIAHGHLILRADEESSLPIVTIFQGRDIDTALLPGAKHVAFEEILAAFKLLGELCGEFERFAGFKGDS